MSKQEEKDPKVTEATVDNEKNDKESLKEDASSDEAIEEQVEASEEDKQMELLQKENQELNDRFVRLAAEYDNFRKRTAKEKSEMYNNAKAQTAAEFLKVADTLERAVNAETENEEHKKGLLLILNQFKEILKSLSIEEVKAQGEKFNPDYHNAVSQVENPDFGENEVCEVYEKGYKLGDRVLRHAIVVVANP